MNCLEWEERVALHVGGDLRDSAVEEHLADCAGCQVFASGLQWTLAGLKAAHAQEIPPAHYAAVRARVMAELERSRRPWGLVWAVVGLAAVFLAIAIPARMRVAELPAVALRIPPPPVVAVAATPAPRKRPSRPPTQRRYGTKELLVRFQTEDPDVVIYWITETKGELLR